MAKFGLGGRVGPVRAGISTRGVGGGIGPVSAGTSWRRPARKSGASVDEGSSNEFAFLTRPRTAVRPGDMPALQALMAETSAVVANLGPAFTDAKGRRKGIKAVEGVRRSWMKHAQADRFTCVSAPMSTALLMMKVSVMTGDTERAKQALADVTRAYQDVRPSDEWRKE